MLAELHKHCQNQKYGDGHRTGADQLFPSVFTIPRHFRTIQHCHQLHAEAFCDAL